MLLLGLHPAAESSVGNLPMIETDECIYLVSQRASFGYTDGNSEILLAETGVLGSCFSARLVNYGEHPRAFGPDFGKLVAVLAIKSAFDKSENHRCTFLR